MKRFILILFFPFILSATAENLSNADAYPLKFSIDISNNMLMDVVNNIEDVINIQKTSDKITNKLQFEWKDINLYDRYYDVPKLVLLKKNTRIYQRTFVEQYITTRKGKKKKTKDNIIYIDELNIERVFIAKKYKKVKEFWGKHPLLGKIKRKERGDLASSLNMVGIKSPLRLKNILNLRSVGRRLTVSTNNKKITSIDILNHQADSMGSEVHYATIHFLASHDKEANSIATKISAKLQKYLNTSSKNANLYSENRYKHAFNILSDEVALLSYRITYPVFVKIFYSLLWFIIGGILILILFRKRMIS